MRSLKRLSGLARHVTTAAMQPIHYDVITIGSGGGAKVSTAAANLGFKVAMIEHGFTALGVHKHGLGGTCLNRGCIPSKMLIHPADVMVELHEAERFGIKATTDGIDFEALVTRCAASIDKDSDSILPGYDGKPNKHLYKDTAKFIGHKTLQVGEHVLTADHIFLAAGAEPTVPDVPGLASTPFLTSTDALRLTKLPKKLIVLGAGYIATELGHMFGGCGAEVHMMARSKLLRALDAEAQQEFERVFESRYHCHKGVTLQRVEHSEGNGFTLHYLDAENQPQVMNADQLLVCAGVTPVGPKLDLDKTGVQLRRGGFVQVDGNLRTACPGIYCFGDLAGNFLFRHCANFEGEYLLEHVIHPLAALKKENKPIPEAGPDYPAIDYTGMPWAVFSNPQVAGVGMSEEQVQAANLKYVKGVNLYRKSAMGDARLSDHGFVKVLIEIGTRKILGCVIVGYEASTMIHTVIPLMRQGGRLDDLLSNMIYIHPALPEILRNSCRKARDALVEAGDDIPLNLRLK